MSNNLPTKIFYQNHYEAYGVKVQKQIGVQLESL